MSSRPLLSIVSPVYGAQGIVSELVSRVVSSVSSITSNFEIVLVEDHSPDASWAEMMEEAAKDPRVRVAKLSRNFGQHNAIAAGLELSSGDYVVLMDCDLQHDPAYIPEMYETMRQGFDVVLTRTRTREHSSFKNFLSRMFYKFLTLIGDFEMDPGVGNYSMISRKVVAAYNSYADYRKAYLWTLKWLGFNTSYISIDHKGRHAGETSYSIKRLISLATSIAVFNSNRLLYFVIFLGVGVSLLSFVGGVYVIIKYLLSSVLAGWTSLIVCIMFFSGLILSCIGVSAIYIANIFSQVKGRPRYVIDELINFQATGQGR